MGLTSKILVNLYTIVIECLEIWANYDDDLIKKYIKDYVPHLYKNILGSICALDKDGILRPFKSDVEIEVYVNEYGYVDYSYNIEPNFDKEISYNDFYKKYLPICKKLFTDNLVVELFKYTSFDKGKQFVFNIHYRTIIAIIITRELFEFRNYINNITFPNSDPSELLASSLFCRTVFINLINGYVPFDGYEYILFDIFGIRKELDVNILVNSNGYIDLFNLDIANF